MRTKHRGSHRFIALLLAATTLLTSFNMLAFALPVVAAGEEEPITIRSDALHFVIRHWHTNRDEEAKLNPDQAGDTTDDYFVLV